jgi:hypothetical protein
MMIKWVFVRVGHFVSFTKALFAFFPLNCYLLVEEKHPGFSLWKAECERDREGERVHVREERRSLGCKKVY